MKTAILAAILASASTVAFADSDSSTFHQTCSNFGFVYIGTDAGISATCLTKDGTPNQTQIKIDGISNENGILTATGGASTFQRSCGSIEVGAEGTSAVILYASCRLKNEQVNHHPLRYLGFTM